MPGARHARNTTGGVTRAAIYGGDRQVRRVVLQAGEEVRAARLRARLSQAAVARAVGVSRSVICELEQGDPTASLTVWSRVASTLGCDLRLSIYPSSRPLIHDAAHARLIERLLRLCHARWRPIVEAPVPGLPRQSTDVRAEDGRDVRSGEPRPAPRGSDSRGTHQASCGCPRTSGQEGACRVGSAADATPPNTRGSAQNHV
jgi:DNA-binding XRE family transcriptional regulator